MEVLTELWKEEVDRVQHIRISLPRRPALPCGVSQQHLNQSTPNPVASLDDSSPLDLRRQTIELLWQTRTRLDLQRRYGKGGNNGLKTPQVSPVDMEIIKEEEEEEDEGP